MSTTGFASFDSTLEKTNRVLRDVEEHYGWTKKQRSRSYAALRSVLHALRDRLTVEECADLSAQLPMLIRGIYYEAWNPSHVPVKLHREEFLERVAAQLPYEVEGEVEDLVQTTLRALRPHITEGEWTDIKDGLPKEVAEVLP
ncbi:DUF2267 domain-containing protein [Saccharopolyspora rhizosphaerae]|uniref:DUF2267 domain-containing protein n=1 Tax=Saccharopolyspora rhizosphaerae TaxID=2492662 RepID=A0A3R8P1Z6_9PSEU|nr:DUF2267 domain-containing protein [Saccharopolyspora rhizosphaerae]RRO14686.1 DUF2267 domain-containing protein [Saccharopolyspora rhizosphaerae]